MINDIVIVTKKGIIIRFPQKDLLSQHRGGRGVKGIELIKGDEVISAFTVKK